MAEGATIEGSGYGINVSGSASKIIEASGSGSISLLNVKTSAATEEAIYVSAGANFTANGCVIEVAGGTIFTGSAAALTLNNSGFLGADSFFTATCP